LGDKDFMKQLTRILTTETAHEATLSLPIHKRIKSRLRVELDNGEEAGLFIQRGITLRCGDLLSTDDGFIVKVVSADESVSTVRTDDAHLLTRVAYHLGNRHVPLEVGSGYVRYLHDHVLDEMVEGLGAKVICEQAPFEPEAGAYGGSHGHGHSHGHSHSHEHDNAHSHEHSHAG
jgi:urease accessory protein